MKLEPSVANIPNGLAAAGLSNVGFAILWFNLGDFNGFLPSVVWLVLLHATVGVVMLATFLLRACCYPKETARDLVSTPANMTVVGAISIELALLGKLMSNFEDMNLTPVNIKVSTSLVILATTVSLTAIAIFIPVCIKTKTYPEPYFCVVLYSILFMVVSFPGDNHLVRITKDVVFLVGIVLSPAILIMIPRAVYPREREKDVVANNPSVCIMQAGPGILCTAWLSYPLLHDTTAKPGAVISHLVFTLSTISFVSVLIALFQRRKQLSTIGVHPQWVAISFPFINSAIASGVYRSYFPSPYITVWSFLLTGIAICNHFTVNFMYFSKFFFIYDNYGIYNRLRLNSDGDKAALASNVDNYSGDDFQGESRATSTQELTSF